MAPDSPLPPVSSILPEFPSELSSLPPSTPQLAPQPVALAELDHESPLPPVSTILPEFDSRSLSSPLVSQRAASDEPAPGSPLPSVDSILPEFPGTVEVDSETLLQVRIKSTEMRLPPPSPDLKRQPSESDQVAPNSPPRNSAPPLPKPSSQSVKKPKATRRSRRQKGLAPPGEWLLQQPVSAIPPQPSVVADGTPLSKRPPHSTSRKKPPVPQFHPSSARWKPPPSSLPQPATIQSSVPRTYPGSENWHRPPPLAVSPRLTSRPAADPSAVADTLPSADPFAVADTPHSADPFAVAETPPSASPMQTRKGPLPALAPRSPDQPFMPPTAPKPEPKRRGRPPLASRKKAAASDGQPGPSSPLVPLSPASGQESASSASQGELSDAEIERRLRERRLIKRRKNVADKRSWG